jgi:polyisoprenoid-binding protein YceI
MRGAAHVIAGSSTTTAPPTANQEPSMLQAKPSSKTPLDRLKRLLASWPWRIALGITAAGVLALAAGAIYAFGIGGGPSQTPLTIATLPTTSSGTILTIDSSASQASFTIQEKLFGQPNTVVGTTNQVAGQIAVNMQDPAQSQVGQIKIDLSTLASDNNLRNRTLQHRILESDQPANQYATFTATSLQGLPSSITIGQAVSFKITGNLTIHQVTRTVTFDTQVTLQSQTQLTGQAQTTVKYKDFNIAIPDVPSVTGVSDDVALALTFTAHT